MLFLFITMSRLCTFLAICFTFWLRYVAQCQMVELSRDRSEPSPGQRSLCWSLPRLTLSHQPKSSLKLEPLRGSEHSDWRLFINVEFYGASGWLWGDFCKYQASGRDKGLRLPRLLGVQGCSCLRLAENTAKLTLLTELCRSISSYFK